MLGTLHLAGMAPHLVAFVGVLLVTGIVMKNAILWWTLRCRERERDSSRKPDTHCCRGALRPIMMTTIASLMRGDTLILQSWRRAWLRVRWGLDRGGGSS